jgi:DNA-binding transcriptional regulator YbjK
MPPPNLARRDRLADAAIGVIAREGARGLTHRAVDAQADEPPGTTSRYFRSRQALLEAAADRILALHLAELAHPPAGPLKEGAIADHMAALAHAALTRERPRHLAALELFVESTRRPELRARMTAARQAQISLVRQIHRAAGVELTDHAAAMLVSGVTGLLFMGLTTPESLGLRSPEDIREPTRQITAAAVRNAKAVPAARSAP